MLCVISVPCTWQVGIALHYSSLSTLLWIGVSARVIYKEAVWRTPRQTEGESSPPPTQRPMLRSVRKPPWSFNRFLYHESIVCCQYGLSFRQLQKVAMLGHPNCASIKAAIVPSNHSPTDSKKKKKWEVTKYSCEARNRHWLDNFRDVWEEEFVTPIEEKVWELS